MDPPPEPQEAGPAQHHPTVRSLPLLVPAVRWSLLPVPRLERRILPCGGVLSPLRRRTAPDLGALLPDEIAAANGGAGGEGPGDDDGDAAKKHGPYVEDAVEAAGGAADAHGVEGGASVLAAGEEAEVADEEADSAEERVGEDPSGGGVDLDGDAGGRVVGEEAGGDAEDEFVVPGRILTADAVDAGAELEGGVHPGDGVGLDAAEAGRRLQALGGYQVDLQEVGIHAYARASAGAAATGGDRSLGFKKGTGFKKGGGGGGGEDFFFHSGLTAMHRRGDQGSQKAATWRTSAQLGVVGRAGERLPTPSFEGKKTLPFIGYQLSTKAEDGNRQNRS